MTIIEPCAPFAPLPEPQTASGAPRRVGVEIEFSGLDEHAAADCLNARFGGTLVEVSPHCLEIKGSAVGTLKVELDTALTKQDVPGLRGAALDLIRGVVPIEIITEPLGAEQVAEFNAVIADLRDAGATGSREGMFLGFGVHLNAEVVAAEAAHTFRTVRAFALMEPWMRARNAIDMTRRLLPFVKAWPRDLVDLLVCTKPSSMADLIDLCDPHIRTRNHSLDLLPLFKSAVPGLFDASYPDATSTTARPAFHFRLPDSRINEPEWSLAHPWEMWHQVERVAASSCLEALEEERMAFMQAKTVPGDAAWIEKTQDVLERCD